MRSWWRVPFVAETVLLEAGLQLLSPMFCQVNDSRLPLAVTRLIAEQHTETMRLRRSRNTLPDICTSSWTLERSVSVMIRYAVQNMLLDRRGLLCSMHVLVRGPFWQNHSLQRTEDQRSAIYEKAMQNLDDRRLRPPGDWERHRGTAR
jgi:hypothetical protein